MVKSYRNQTTLYGSDIDGNGQSISDLLSLSTEDQTINNSVTYPDGTTVTTSPSGGGGLWTEDTEYRDPDGGTVFDSGFMDLTAADMYRVDIVVATGGDSTLGVQTAGDSGDNYEYRASDGTRFANPGQWELAQSTFANLHGGTFIFLRRPPEADPTGGYSPKFIGVSGTFVTDAGFQYGIYTGSNTPDSLRVFQTAASGSGVVKIGYRNL